MYRLIFIFFLFVCAEAKAQVQKPAVANVELSTIEGEKYVLKDFGELSVVVFLSPGCPLSQKYTLVLNSLAKEFHDKVKFYGVFAETDPVLDEYKEFEKKYKIQFALLVDKEQKLVKALAANVTPEAFVLSKGKLIYHGAIDDWAIELGKTKAQATINFVRNAIQCAMANTTPVPNYNKPVGCFID